MDIIQEVTTTQTLVAELLLNLYHLQPDEEDKLKDELPTDEFKKLSYVLETHNKLMNDDEYSLSEKGLITFRTESQSLLHYLRSEYQAIQEAHSTAKAGNPLFNQKTHILNWQTPVTWSAVILHTFALAIAVLICFLCILLIYKITDFNNLVLVTGVVAFFTLFLAVPKQITEKNGKSPSIKFTIVSTSFLLWKSLFILIPFVGISIILVIFKKYWIDDILIILTIGLPIAIAITATKCNMWLEDAQKIENKSPITEEAN
jgi:hypothetical protein